MDIKLIRAFIASPGGLEDERRAAYDAAEEVNRSVARNMGARLELIGWEETLSGIGRPQEIINADMDTCDLFIGVMSTRWGSRPSADGPYTSGFEEEFSRSFKRHQETNRPHMAMFFKEIDTERLRDPGDELKKVLAFQEHLRAERALLYNVFTNTEQFASRVREFLCSHVVNLLRPDPVPQAERPKKAQKQSDTDKGGAQPDSAPANRLEANFLRGFALSLENGAEKSPADIAHLRLLAMTTGTSQNDKEVIGVHDANILYQHPADFSDNEIHGLLVRGLASLQDENVPLWSWLATRVAKRAAVLQYLSVLGEEDERVGALDAMRLLAEPVKPIGEVSPSEIVGFWFKDGTPDAVRIAALRYIRRHGKAEFLPHVLLEIERASKDTTDGALLAAVSVKLRQEPLSSADFLLSASFEALYDKVIDEVLGHFSELGTDRLRHGLDHRAPRIRAKVVAILSRRGVLSIETLDRALDDDAAEVRMEAVKAKEHLGQPLSLDEAQEAMARQSNRLGRGFLFTKPAEDKEGLARFGRYRAERLMSLSLQSLEALLHSTSHRDAAFRALAVRKVDPYGRMLRENLDDGYAEYFSRYWPEGIKPEGSALSGLASFLATPTPADEEAKKKRELVEEGLAVVASQRDSADLPLVRAVVDRDHTMLTESVIGYFKSLGSSEDVARLVWTPRYRWQGIFEGDLQAEFIAAAQAILKMSKEFCEVIDIEMPNEMRAKLIEIVQYSEFAKLTDYKILELLWSEDHVVRRATAMKVASSISKSRIKKLYVSYKAEGRGIYYLVTHWLDLGLAYPRQIVRQVVQERLA